nr:putative catalase [Claviceps pusilla]
MASQVSLTAQGSGLSAALDGPEHQTSNTVDLDPGLIDLLSRFNREKIPERAVHARGAGAYGEFEVTHDVSDICDIDMLLGIGKKTPCAVRLSTTALARGSAESVRDVKGMAVKLFTGDGEWDWICLNIPMFFIRDPSKFPDLVHSQRPDPATNLGNPTAWWEFVCDNHSSLHLTIFLYSDFGTMFDYRSMSGYVCHAYKWVMPDGTWKYVHWFLTTDQGPNFEQGNRKRDVDPNDSESATRDLYQSLERGEYPSWTVKVQVVDPEDAPRLAFNILDVSKHWNLGIYPPDIPVIPERCVGKLTLKKGSENYFDEIEKLAFSPSHLVHGVEPSEDPVLQARLFAYPDAQKHRLGPQYSDMQAKRTGHAANGAPKTKKTAVPLQKQSREHAEWVAQVKSSSWSQPNETDYTFARGLWDAMPRLRGQEFQDRLVVNLAESLSQIPEDLRQRVYKTLALVAEDLASRVGSMTEKMVVPEERARL